MSYKLFCIDKICACIIVRLSIMKNKENLSQTAAAIRQRKRRAAEALNERETRLTMTVKVRE